MTILIAAFMLSCAIVLAAGIIADGLGRGHRAEALSQKAHKLHEIEQRLETQREAIVAREQELRS